MRPADQIARRPMGRSLRHRQAGDRFHLLRPAAGRIPAAAARRHHEAAVAAEEVHSPGRMVHWDSRRRLTEEGPIPGRRPEQANDA